MRHAHNREKSKIAIERIRRECLNMMAVIGPVIAALMVAGLAAVCVREIYKGHKSGGCGGCSGGCSGCSGSCSGCSGCAHRMKQK